MSDNNKQEQEIPKEGEIKAPDNQNNKEEKKELTLEEKLKETEEKLLRSLAEIENQRRRFEKDIKDAFEFGSFNFAKENLAILDNINILEKDLVSIFERNRIKKIEVQDKKFDPNFHQAMSEVEDDKVPPGSILQEIQVGYMLGDRLLRPALVSVSKKKSSKDQENIEKKEKN